MLLDDGYEGCGVDDVESREGKAKRVYGEIGVVAVKLLRYGRVGYCFEILRDAPDAGVEFPLFSHSYNWA